MSREELERRGPRRLHWNWTRNAIFAGCIPAEYLREFPDDDPEDILCHLRELINTESDLSLYVTVYRGGRFLSNGLREAWLDEEIDLADTGIDPSGLRDLLRKESAGYRAADTATPRRITWQHPDTGRSVGSAFNRKVHRYALGQLTVTSPAALSCLQLFWDSQRCGINIETWYMKGTA